MFYHHFSIVAAISTRVSRAAWNQFYTISEPREIDTRYKYKIFFFVVEQFALELHVACPTTLALKLLLFTSCYGAIYKPKNG